MLCVWPNIQAITSKCEELIQLRTHANDKGEYARFVLQNIFENEAIDLLTVSSNASEIHEEALKRLNGLIGFESMVFKIIYTSDTLFQEFLEIFALHAVSSTALPSQVTGSIYAWLLKDYLSHILPVDDRKLSVLKSSNWLAAPLRSPSSMQSVSSPRRLLRPEVIAASSPLDYGMRSVSLRNLHPRFVQFFSGLVGHLTTLSIWATVTRCEVLRIILAHYIEFMLRETDDADFVSLKFLFNDNKESLFISSLQTFIRKLLQKWPLNNTYVELIELWRTVTYHPSLETRSQERRKQFVDISARYFLGDFALIMERVIHSDCIEVLDSRVLDYIERIVNTPGYLSVLRDYTPTPYEDYLNAVLWRLTVFCEDQKELAAAKANESLWSKMTQLISNNTSHYVVLAEQHIATIRNHLQSAGKLGCLGITPAGPSSSTPIATSRLPYKMRAPMNSWGDMSSISGINNHSGTVDSFSDVFNRTAGSCSSVLSQTVAGIDEPTVPDHDVDPWTKLLYLTSSGRHQVINRKSHFDFKNYSQQIAETFPHKEWEISFLAKWLHDLSLRCSNCWLVNYLRFHRNDSVVTKTLAEALLCAPSPPRYVPAFSRAMPQYPSRLNLRLFAYVPFLISVFVVLYILFLLISWVLF